MWLFLWISWNVISFMLFGIDKLCAIWNVRRIPEKLLIAMAFCMGAFGAFLGMLLFHHKIRKRKFVVLIPLAIVINLALLTGIFHLIV